MVCSQDLRVCISQYDIRQDFSELENDATHQQFSTDREELYY